MSTQPDTVLNKRAIRKALMDQYGFSAADVAADVPCAREVAARVIRGEGKYETPNSKRVKELFSSRVGLPVEELWAEDEGVTVSSTERAEPEVTP